MIPGGWLEKGENYINTSMIHPIMQWLIDATLSYNTTNDYIIIAGSCGIMTFYSKINLQNIISIFIHEQSSSQRAWYMLLGNGFNVKNH